MINRLSADYDYVDDAIEIRNKFNVPDSVIASAEVQEAAKQGMIISLSYGWVDLAIEIRDKFNVPEEIITSIDAEVVELLEVGSLIHKVKYLGSEDFKSLFPKTYAMVIEQVGENLVQDLDLADYFLENLDKYYDKPWVEDYLVKAVQHYSVAQKFKVGLKQETMAWVKENWVEKISKEVKKIITEKASDTDEKSDSDSEVEGFMEEDPYEGHVLRRTKIWPSIELSRLMKKQATPVEVGMELSAKAVEALEEINSVIEKEHNDFLKTFKSSSFVPEEDKLALSDPENSKVKMNNLLPNVRSFVGRYLAQLANLENEDLSEVIVSQKDLISSMLKEGYKRYLNIYKMDIPLYDKLYEEFDNWRESGRYPMEVYLGRDGIYTYIGRRAQDAARRSKLGKAKREKLASEGEIIEINPKYVVYPRYFRDNLKREIKVKFLEQERITADMDPLFYDTGYSGSIPEQIMRYMHFYKDDIEERIRLLSAPTPKRRVRGVSENARDSIVNYIEHNAKTEDTAEGLIIDKQTGKIRHVAEPAPPKEQFYFMLVKQAIARHYMIKERLEFGPPETVNYDSEDFRIRIQRDYAEVLPEDFVKDPKKYFKEKGVLLKGGEKEGEYPDEEVLSFKLEDGTEVIAKRIELRKAKEARKEFMILIASKKAGLPTAEPIGFLSGKEEEDGSYLIMEKLEGYSGRKFEKYLKKSEKFTEEQISRIMKEVADKLKDLAEMFRKQLNIDKRWRIKDTIIQFNEETGEIEGVIPIDWERVKTYNPDKPKKIDLVE